MYKVITNIYKVSDLIDKIISYGFIIEAVAYDDLSDEVVIYAAER
jgi:hypothetical protein